MSGRLKASRAMGAKAGEAGVSALIGPNPPSPSHAAMEEPGARRRSRLWHCGFAVHSSPAACRHVPTQGAHLPPMQLPDTQSELVAQVVPMLNAHSLLLQALLAQSPGTAQNTPSGSPQTPPLHCPVLQSDAPAQGWHVPVVAQCALAQSRSSVQASPVCSLQKSAAHVPLKQSVFLLHTWPARFSAPIAVHAPEPLHAELAPQVGLPSSPLGTSVHVPVPAAHESAHWPLQAVPQQTPPTQNVLVQSAVPPHAFPVAQGGQLPPQSVSVSSPSFFWSVQAVHLPSLHSVAGLRQSLRPLQPSSSGQPGQVAPPQSTSVSSPSFTWLEQLTHVSM